MTAGRRATPITPVTLLPTPELALREVMSTFATGITVVTASGAHCHGMTANAFTSVSLDPPMVLCCVSRTARLHEAILTARSFGVSVLSEAQEDVARYFASRDRPSGLAQFERFDWTAGEHTNAPLIDGSLAWLECELAEVYHGGDHAIFLGRVLAASRSDGSALLFFGGGFRRSA